MLKKLVQQYQLLSVLNPLVNAVAPYSAWWLVDVDGSVIYKTVDRQPPENSEGVQWELKAGDIRGLLIAGDDYPQLRDLGNVVAHIFSILLQNEAERTVDNIALRKAQEESQVHLRACQALGTVLKREDIPSALLKEARSLIQVKGGVVYEMQSGVKLWLAQTSGRTPYGSPPPRELTVGLLHHVAQSGEAVWLNDIHNHPQATMLERQAQNALILPVEFQNELYGVVGLFDNETDFTPQDVRLLSVLAGHAGMAYANAATVDALLYGEDHTMEADGDLLVAGDEADWQEVVD